MIKNAFPIAEEILREVVNKIITAIEQAVGP